MARITVEDCLEKVESRFDLVLKASERARDLISTSAEPLVEPENDKPTIIALREIAEGGDLVVCETDSRTSVSYTHLTLPTTSAV